MSIPRTTDGKFNPVIGNTRDDTLNQKLAGI